MAVPARQPHPRQEHRRPVLKTVASRRFRFQTSGHFKAALVAGLALLYGSLFALATDREHRIAKADQTMTQIRYDMAEAQAVTASRLTVAELDEEAARLGLRPVTAEDIDSLSDISPTRMADSPPDDLSAGGGTTTRSTRTNLIVRSE